MFSALKKLVGSEQAPGRDKNIPAGLQSMNQALQRRFAKGVQYNSEYGPGARGFRRCDVESGVRGPRCGRARALAPGTWQKPGRALAREALPGVSPFAGRLWEVLLVCFRTC